MTMQKHVPELKKGQCGTMILNAWRIVVIISISAFDKFYTSYLGTFFE